MSIMPKRITITIEWDGTNFIVINPASQTMINQSIVVEELHLTPVYEPKEKGGPPQIDGFFLHIWLPHSYRKSTGHRPYFRVTLDFASAALLPSRCDVPNQKGKLNENHG